MRRALTLSLDRPTLARVITGGRGMPGQGTLTPLHWAFSGEDGEGGLPYDTIEARRLFDEAGWRPGADDMLADAAGEPFRFSLTIVSANQTHADAAQIIQAQLRRVGVRVDIRQLEYNTLLQQAQQGGEESRGVEALLMAFVSGVRTDDAFFFHSRHLADAGQVAGYANPRVDLLLDTLAVTLDRDAARPLWAEYQRWIVEEAPATVLYYPGGLAAVSRRLNGAEVDGRGLLTNAQGWWIASPDR